MVGIGKKRKKRKTNLYVVTISDNPKSLSQTRRLTYGVRYFWNIIFLAVIAALVAFIAVINYRNTVLSGRENVYKASVEELKAENDELKAENQKLQDEVSILTTTVNEKNVVVSAIEERSVPTGFPLSVAVDYSEGTEEKEIEGEKLECPYLEFTVNNGTFALSAGEGTVLSVTEDSVNGWEVMVDHGNGYVSCYRTGNSKPKVRQGDEVAKGSPLCEMKAEKGSSKLIYQIILDGTYIDPKEVFEIKG